MRAVDYMVESAGGADKVKAAIIYDQTDYGKDGFEGFKAAAAAAGVTVVAEQAVAPGQKDFTAVVGALKQAGASHVLPDCLGILNRSNSGNRCQDAVPHQLDWADTKLDRPFLRASTAPSTGLRWLRLGKLSTILGRAATWYGRFLEVL